MGKKYLTGTRKRVLEGGAMQCWNIWQGESTIQPKETPFNQLLKGGRMNGALCAVGREPSLTSKKNTNDNWSRLQLGFEGLGQSNRRRVEKVTEKTNISSRSEASPRDGEHKRGVENTRIRDRGSQEGGRFGIDRERGVRTDQRPNF